MNTSKINSPFDNLSNESSSMKTTKQISIRQSRFFLLISKRSGTMWLDLYCSGFILYPSSVYYLCNPLTVFKTSIIIKIYS